MLPTHRSRSTPPVPHAAPFDEAGRRHDAASGLAAIDAAARAMLAGAPDRDGLCRAISDEVETLRRLMEPPVEPATERLSLARELASIVTVARAAGTQVTVDVHDELVARGNRTDLHRVLRNLIDNATTHAPRSPVEISAEPVGRRIQLRVEDRGPGVAYDDQERIFSPWHRGRYRRNRRASDLNGRGLGLAVASRLAEGMGGRLWVENRPGGGSSFVLTLPAARRRLRVVAGA